MLSKGVDALESTQHHPVGPHPASHMPHAASRIRGLSPPGASPPSPAAEAATAATFVLMLADMLIGSLIITGPPL